MPSGSGIIFFSNFVDVFSLGISLFSSLGKGGANHWIYFNPLYPSLCMICGMYGRKWPSSFILLNMIKEDIWRRSFTFALLFVNSKKSLKTDYLTENCTINYAVQG